MARRAKGKGYIKKEGKEGFFYGYLRTGKKVIRIRLCQNEPKAQKAWDEWLKQNAQKVNADALVGRPLDSVWPIVRDAIRAAEISDSRFDRCLSTWKGLKKVLGERGVDDLTKVSQADLTAYFASLAKSTAVHNNALCYLKKIFEAVLPDITPAQSPLRNFRWKKDANRHKEALTDAEILALLNQCRKENLPEWETLIVIGYNTGLRAKDAVHLRTSQIRDGVLYATPWKTRHRSGTEVQIPVNKELSDALAKCKVRNHYFLPGLVDLYDNGGPSKFNQTRQRLWARAGVSSSERGEAGRIVQTKGFHALRVTFISRLAEKNVQLGLIQSMAGHIGPAQTQAYAHPNLKSKIDALDKLPRIADLKPEVKKDQRYKDLVRAFGAAVENLAKKIEEENAKPEMPKATLPDLLHDLLPDLESVAPPLPPGAVVARNPKN